MSEQHPQPVNESGPAMAAEAQPPRLRFSKRRLALAFALAALSDGLSLLLTFTPPFQWALDLVTALVLFLVLGWQWVMLPGLILEAIPGFNILPLWMLVVGAVALLGTVRPDPKALLRAGQEVGKALGIGSSDPKERDTVEDER